MDIVLFYLHLLISFKVNHAFKAAESHAGEIEMLYTYAPMAEYGEEGTYPYLAVQLDDEVYMEITPISDKFYFKAKMEYYEYIMYFYAMDRQIAIVKKETCKFGIL